MVEVCQLERARLEAERHRCSLKHAGYALGLTVLALFSRPGLSQTTTPDVASQGKYVSLAADCASCHTAPDGKPFAGGNPLKSAFGTIYGSNITSDMETGIGSWTKADFVKALRSGIRKDGSYLYPAMPYGSYTKMSDADMDALWIYIHGIPAVKSTPPKNTLPFPLSVRSGMAVWQSLYFKPGPFIADPKRDATWNRGAYLVLALGHCNDCHTPRNLAQGLEPEHALTGAQIEGWYAPNISNDPLSKINSWNTADLEHYLKSGVAPGNIKSFGPMQEVVHDSLAHLNPQDLHAIAVYLKAQGNHATSVTASAVKLDTSHLQSGKSLYEDNCASCHQNTGKGIAGSVPALAHNDAVTASEPYNVIMAMLEGFEPEGKWGAMGSFAASLNDDQIADIANYVRTAWGNGGAPNATPWEVANWRKNAEVAKNESNPLLCPSLSQDIMQPALKSGPEALKAAAGDPRKMQTLVGQYKAARPSSSTAQIIEALSTAYCKTIAVEHISQARLSTKIASFAQGVAVAVPKPTPTS